MRKLFGFMLSVMSTVAFGAGALPERQVTQAKGYVIEYSTGDEAYATALLNHLPLKSAPETPAVTVPLSVTDLRARRAELLKLLATRLALAQPTPTMSQTFDAFVDGFTA